VTKKEIVWWIADQLQKKDPQTKKESQKESKKKEQITQLLTKRIVQLMFQAILDTLVNEKEHRIELRNFGVFQVKLRKPRKARNPRTGDKVDVPAKCVVTFKPGKMMEERVRQIPPEELQAEDEEEKERTEDGEPEAAEETEAVNGVELDGEPVAATGGKTRQPATPKPRGGRSRKASR
jgi:nucleoid DNA-binding protein